MNEDMIDERDMELEQAEKELKSSLVPEEVGALVWRSNISDKEWQE